VGNHHISKSDCGQEKSSPSDQTSKEHLSTIVREISQARLMRIRKKRSELAASTEAQDDGKRYTFDQQQKIRNQLKHKQ